MPRRPRSATTRLFSSEGGSDSDTCSDLWETSGARQRTQAGGRSINDDDLNDNLVRNGDMSPTAVLALKAALRASRVRASAAFAKASRLQEETLRLRDAVKVTRKDADRADGLEDALAKSELRVRELECDKRRLKRELDGIRTRTRQFEAKTNASVSALRDTLKSLEDGQRARCRRWRNTTTSLRALLESLRRHVQRGHHAAPSYTAFQLIEQLFLCLEKQEAEARPMRPTSVQQTTASRPQTVKSDESGDDVVSSTDGSKEDGALVSALRDENTRLRRLVEISRESTPVARNQGSGGVDDPSSLQRFPAEAAYQLAVTKLTAQLKAAKERLRAEKEDVRSMEERAEQEERRCRRLELEVEGLSAKVAAAEANSKRLEETLKEARAERDLLKRRQHSAAAKALHAARRIAEQRDRGHSSVHDPIPGPPSARHDTAFIAPLSDRGVVPEPVSSRRHRANVSPPVSGAKSSATGEAKTKEPATERHTPGPTTGARFSSRAPSRSGGLPGATAANRASLFQFQSENSKEQDSALDETDAVVFGREAEGGSVNPSVFGRGNVWSSAPAGTGEARKVGSSPGSGTRGTVGGSWGLGPRAVTAEDLARLDEEIARLSNTVEQAALAQTRQILRNVMSSVERHAGDEAIGIRPRE